MCYFHRQEQDAQRNDSLDGRLRSLHEAQRGTGQGQAMDNGKGRDRPEEWALVLYDEEQPRWPGN